MRTSTYFLYALVGLTALCQIGFSSPIVKRQILDNPNYIDPAQQDLETQEEQDRGKRKIEGAVELTYGAKNAILGLFFNKINSFIDQKTAWVNQLDQINVAKNKQYNIESPKDPITSFGNIFGSHTYKFLLNKPKFFHLPHLGKLANPIPPILPMESRPKRAVAEDSGAAAPSRVSRQGKAVQTTTEDLVMFTPGQKVSLEVPGELFGSGFTLITNLSQVVGSLIQNSAERTARIFESMKPFLQTVFGVRSLTITRDGPKDNAV